MYILVFTAKTHIFIQNVFLPKSNQILQYGNILQYTQTQYTYCFIPIVLCMHYEVSKDSFTLRSLLDLQTFKVYQGSYSTSILNHTFIFG